MLFKSLLSLAASASLLKSVAADDLPAIEIVGNKFFYSNNGSQFYIKGVAYQQDTANSTGTFSDPLADADACERDIPYLQELATNTIRVYALNISEDHTDCMNMLADAGIYVIADLSEPDTSIDRDDPTWTVELYERYMSVVDAFQNYTNVLGFFAGNEVTNDDTNTDASAFVKAAVRDTKAYISAQGYRDIPVGYSSNDASSIRVYLADYFACGDTDDRADFFGINMYEWCGDSSYSESGYETATENFQNLSIPIFFSEYGCNAVQPREFTEVATLYGDNMTDVWSGGIVYMYFEETNDYGLVTIDNDEVSTLTDFEYYSSEINNISPSSAQSSDQSSSTSELSCPSQNAYWKASTDLPPTPDSGLCECIEAASSCVVSDDVDSDDYADLFSIVCGYVDCSGISANGTTGEYGAYSFCSSKQQLDFLLSLYYSEQGDDSACSFDGSATINSDATTYSTCSSAISAAGTDGTGSVSGAVSVAGTASGDTGTATDDTSASASAGTASSSSTSTSSSSGSAASIRIPGGDNLVGSILALVAIGGFSIALI